MPTFDPETPFKNARNCIAIHLDRVSAHKLLSETKKFTFSWFRVGKSVIVIVLGRGTIFWSLVCSEKSDFYRRAGGKNKHCATDPRFLRFFRGKVHALEIRARVFMFFYRVLNILGLEGPKWDRETGGTPCWGKGARGPRRAEDRYQPLKILSKNPSR